jgi:hypothetical protein
MKSIRLRNLGALIAIIILSQIPIACKKSESGSPSGSEIVNAKQALDRLNAASQIGQLADCLTNRSAAAAGMGFVVGAKLMVAMAEGIGSGEQPPPGGPAAQDQDMKAMNSDLDGVLARYGVQGEPTSQQDRQKLEQTLEGRGREFLTDMVVVFDKYKSLTKEASSPDLKLVKSNEADFQVISPSAVKITRKDGKPVEETSGRTFLEARLEDGKWRIDLGGIQDVLGATPSATSEKTSPATQGDVTGAYFARDTLPDDFSEIEHLSLATIDDQGNPAPLNGFIRPKRRSAEDYRLVNPKLDGKNLSFTTTAAGGVSYSFTGSFLKLGDFSANPPAGDEVILRGKLRKMVDGNVVSETDVNFSYSAGG